MYIIGSQNNINNIKLYNQINNNIKFIVIDYFFIEKILSNNRLFQSIEVNYKKINIVMYEISKSIILYLGIKSPFILILDAIIIHNKGQKLFIFPVSKNKIDNISILFSNLRKIREICNIMYSKDGYIVNNNIYKNKLIIKKNSFIYNNKHNQEIEDIQNIKIILTYFNYFINKYVGIYMINYLQSNKMNDINKIIVDKDREGFEPT